MIPPEALTLDELLIHRRPLVVELGGQHRMRSAGVLGGIYGAQLYIFLKAL